MNYPNYPNPYVNQSVYQNPYSYNQQPVQNSIIWVNSKEDVERYPVNNDCAVILYKKDFKKLYLKKVDEFGASSIRVFDICEEKEDKAVNDLLKRIETLEAQILKEPKGKKDDKSNDELFSATNAKS